MADERKQSSLSDTVADVLDDLMVGRRSIRKYKNDPLSEELMAVLLKCALLAPSPSNSQPVRLVHIRSGHHIERLKQALMDGHRRLIDQHKEMKGPARLRNYINAYHRYALVMFNAPVLLAVGATTNTEGFSSKLVTAGLSANHARHQIDVDMTVGLALENLMLKAWSEGVGSCILTAPLVFIENVEGILSLDSISIKCFVTLGFPDETPKDPGRLPLDDVVKVI